MAEVSRGITSHVVTNLSVCVGAYNGSDHWDHCHRYWYCFEDSRPSGHWTTQDLLLEPFCPRDRAQKEHTCRIRQHTGQQASLLEGLLLSYTYRAISASISFKRSSPVFSAILVWRGGEKSKSRIESKYVDLLVLKVRQPLIHDGFYFYRCYCSQVTEEYPRNDFMHHFKASKFSTDTSMFFDQDRCIGKS